MSFAIKSTCNCERNTKSTCSRRALATPSHPYACVLICQTRAQPVDNGRVLRQLARLRCHACCAPCISQAPRGCIFKSLLKETLPQSCKSFTLLIFIWHRSSELRGYGAKEVGQTGSFMWFCYTWKFKIKPSQELKKRCWRELFIYST
jgi:hypothetical protein